MALLTEGIFVHVGGFYGPRRADESVLAMCLDEENTMLVVADTAGFVSVYDVSNYANGEVDPEYATQQPASLITSWAAHTDSCVSAELIEHNCGKFVLTASTDKTVKLFSIQGELVGRFGQQDNWDLVDRSTWAVHREDDSFQFLQNTEDNARISSAAKDVLQKSRKSEFAESAKQAPPVANSSTLLDVATEPQRAFTRSSTMFSSASILGNAVEMKFQKKLENRAQRRKLLLPDVHDTLAPKSSLYKYLHTSVSCCFSPFHSTVPFTLACAH